MPKEKNTKSLGIAELIRQVRTELVASEQERKDRREAALFQVTEFELELQFVVQESDNVKGGFDLKVVSLGSELGSQASEVQTLKIRMKAIEDRQSGELPLGARPHRGQASPPEIEIPK